MGATAEADRIECPRNKERTECESETRVIREKRKESSGKRKRKRKVAKVMAAINELGFKLQVEGQAHSRRWLLLPVLSIR